jgi:hypothetical protein
LRRNARWGDFSTANRLSQAAGQGSDEVVEEDLLVFAGLRDAAGADFFAAACGQHDGDRAEFGLFGQHAARFVAETGALAELAQELP